MSETDKMVKESIVDNWMRLNVLKFLEGVSFDESYIKVVKHFEDNKERYNLFNQLKTIRSFLFR